MKANVLFTAKYQYLLMVMPIVSINTEFSRPHTMELNPNEPLSVRVD